MRLRATVKRWTAVTYLLSRRRLWRNRLSPWQHCITTQRLRTVQTFSERLSHFAFNFIDATNNFSLSASIQIYKVCANSYRVVYCVFHVFFFAVNSAVSAWSVVTATCHGSDVIDGLFQELSSTHELWNRVCFYVLGSEPPHLAFRLKITIICSWIL